MNAYVNGNPIALEPIYGRHPISGQLVNVNHLFIGRVEEGVGHYAGLVDEVEVFARALSQEEIRAIYNAATGARCYTFDGTIIDTETWEVSAPLGDSTVTQNDELLLTSDGTGGAFCNTPDLRGPGAGIALRRRLAGDFDIQVDFRNFSGRGAVYFNVYQDPSNQMHIKRLRGTEGDGIQTFAVVGGEDINGDVSDNGTTSGTFRITRSGATIKTFLDSASNFLVEAFDGPVIVSLVLGGAGIASVAFDNFVIYSGTLEDQLLVCPVEVSIDIKPEGYPNSINLGSGGTVPVAIISAPEVFDATTVDPTTVMLAGAGVAFKGKGTAMASFQDVDGDGWMDLVVHVTTNALQLTEGDTMALLTGMTFDGTSFWGTDSVRIVRSLPPSSCVPTPPGLISWWRGEDGTDSVGPNNGALVNGTAIEPGIVGAAFSFNGIDGFVEATDIGLPMGSAPRTLEMWVKPADNARAPFIYGNFEAGDAYYAIVEGPNACIGQWADPIMERCGKTDVTDGRWHHIALTYDGHIARLYVDGVLEVHQKKVYATTSIGRVYIGSTVYGSEEYFPGLIDEVAVYSRALTPSEIRAIFTSRSAGKCLPVLECVPPPDGLTNWWTGDGNTDDIIGGRDAVLQGATTGEGLVGQAFYLDGDGDFVDVPHDDALNFGTGDFTIDLWVFFNDTAGEQILVEKWIQYSDEAADGWTLTKLADNRLLLAMVDALGERCNFRRTLHPYGHLDAFRSDAPGRSGHSVYERFAGCPRGIFNKSSFGLLSQVRP